MYYIAKLFALVCNNSLFRNLPIGTHTRVTNVTFIAIKWPLTFGQPTLVNTMCEASHMGTTPRLETLSMKNSSYYLERFLQDFNEIL